MSKSAKYKIVKVDETGAISFYRSPRNKTVSYSWTSDRYDPEIAVFKTIRDAIHRKLSMANYFKYHGAEIIIVPVDGPRVLECYTIKRTNKKTGAVVYFRPWRLRTSSPYCPAEYRGTVWTRDATDPELIMLHSIGEAMRVRETLAAHYGNAHAVEIVYAGDRTL